MKSSLVHGFLVIDKPAGMTSRAVVDRAQGWFPRGTRLGHTGTLDPLATGVLVLAIGTGTRLTEYVQDMDKVYRAGIRLGSRSDTDDADGTITPVPGAAVPDRPTIEVVLRNFHGPIEQVPPNYSAAKITGRRAYDLARQGQALTLRPRTVQIYAIEVYSYAYPLLDLEVRCGKGTYIRALARDLGDRLGCGGYIESLRRTSVGAFVADAGLSLDADPATARERLLPLTTGVSGLPRVTLLMHDVVRLRQGQSVGLAKTTLLTAVECAVFDEAGNFVGVAMWDPETQRLQPGKMLSL
jgi:tRNA pseudouridine55 synthase